MKTALQKAKAAEATRKSRAKTLAADPDYYKRWRAKRYANDPEFYKKIYARQAESRRRYALKHARRYLPLPTRQCPELCEVTGCSRRAVCLDHEHLTWQFRGWLCQPCNRAASKHHTPPLLRALADYMERNT